MNEADMVISQKSGLPSAPEVRQTANGSPSLPPWGRTSSHTRPGGTWQTIARQSTSPTNSGHSPQAPSSSWAASSSSSTAQC